MRYSVSSEISTGHWPFNHKVIEHNDDLVTGQRQVIPLPGSTTRLADIRIEHDPRSGYDFLFVRPGLTATISLPPYVRDLPITAMVDENEEYHGELYTTWPSVSVQDGAAKLILTRVE